jgi:hypothetical protein
MLRHLAQLPQGDEAERASPHRRFRIEVIHEPDLGKAIDLEMLVITPSGRERTEKDFRRLLDPAIYVSTAFFLYLAGPASWKPRPPNP